MNALLFVRSAVRRDMSRLAISITKRIRNSTRRAGSRRDPVPADPPPQNALSQSHQKKVRTSKTSPRRPTWKGSEKDERREKPTPLLLRALPSKAGPGGRGRGRRKGGCQRGKGRLPRIPPPRRRKIRVIWERKREETRKRVSTAVTLRQIYL